MPQKFSTSLTANMPSGCKFWHYLCNYVLYCLPQQLPLKMKDMQSTDWSE